MMNLLKQPVKQLFIRLGLLETPTPSLRKQLLLSLILFSVLLFLLLGFAAYRIALEETQEILDKQMKEMAYFLAETPIEHLDSAFKPNHRYNETDVFIDIWQYHPSRQQQLEARFEDRDHIRLPQVPSAYFQRFQSPIGELKVFVLPLKDKQIQISQLMSVRKSLARELALNMLVPYVLLMPFVLFGLGWLIQYTLRPIHSLQRSIAQRDHQDLTEIQIDHLPLEITPTVEELNHLFRRIDAAQKQQQQFIADAAHELRSPITALNLQLKVLQKTLPYPLAEEKNFSNLKNGLVRIQHLVTQMMALAHQEAESHINTGKLDLTGQVKFAIEQLMYNARRKNIDLGLTNHYDNSIQVIASTVQLQSIIFNVIDNAIKYTPEGGSVDVSLSFNPDYGYICVEDSGPGVRPEDYAKMLERFVRLPSAHQQAIGSGLGLSIVQTAIQQLNGQLHFAQSALGGLSVTIVLPMAG